MTNKQTKRQDKNPLEKLTVLEKAIVLILLRTSEKAGYGDIANVLGRDESAIRKLVSSIEKKNSAIIQKEGNSKILLSIQKKSISEIEGCFN